MKKKRVITKVMAMLLTFAVVLSMMPVGAVFGGGKAISVTFTYSKDNSLVYGPVTLDVYAGQAYEYGIGEEASTTPTVLDAVVAAHAEKYKTDFTSKTAADYVDSSLTKLFGDTGYGGHIINGHYSSDYANAAVLKDGDTVDEFLYHPSYDDSYAAFYENDSIVREINTTTADTVELTAKSFNIMNAYGGEKWENQSGLILGVTNCNGTFTTKEATTDKSGNAKLSFDEEGTYYLTSDGGEASLVPPWCKIVVSKGLTEEQQQTEVTTDKEALKLAYTDGDNVTLPLTGKGGKTKITWASSNPDVVSTKGVVVKALTEQSVTLTATIKCGSISDTKQFTLTVPALVQNEIEARLTAGERALTATDAMNPEQYTGDSGYGTYAYDSEYKDTNILTKATALVSAAAPGVNVSLTEVVSGSEYIANNGTITYSETSGSASVEFKLTIGETAKDVTVAIDVPEYADSKADALKELMADTTLEKVLNGQEKNAVKSTLKLPVGSTYGLGITWTSDNAAIEITKGTSSVTGQLHKITRPAYGEQDAAVTLTAVFDYTADAQSWNMCDGGPMPATKTKTFEVTVPALTQEEFSAITEEVEAAVASVDAGYITAYDAAGKTDSKISADLENITTDLHLYDFDSANEYKKNGVKLTWSSNNPAITVNTLRAKVIRPVGSENAAGNLTVTATKEGITASKSFAVTVLATEKAALSANAQIAIEKITDRYALQTKEWWGNADYSTGSWWQVSAMGAYKAQFGKDKLSVEQKQAIVDKAIATAVTNAAKIGSSEATEATNVSQLGSAITLLSALGYDVENLTTINRSTVKAGTALNKLNLEGAKQGWYSTIAPYTLIALEQGSFGNQSVKDSLVDYLLSIKIRDGVWGWDGKNLDVDTTAMIIHGLATQSSNEKAKAAVQNGVEALASAFAEKDGYTFGNANSDAAVIIALAACSIDPDTDARFVKDGNSIVDGMLTYLNKDMNAFTYTYNGVTSDSELATVQATLALIAVEAMCGSKTAVNVIDFSNVTKTAATAASAGSIAEPAESTGDNITVSVTIKSDTEYWLNNYSVTVPGEGATVYHAFTKACSDNNITSVGAANGYVSSISKGTKTLTEFDKGQNSGWMYKVNGTLPDVGLTSYSIKNGDNIVWFYTTDWTKVPGVTMGDQNKSQVTTSGSDTKITTAPAEVKTSGTTATATVTDETAADLVKQAKENNSKEVVISASSAKDTETVNFELPKSTLESISKDTSATVTVKTDAGEINLDKVTLDQIAGEASGKTVLIEIGRVSEPDKTQKAMVGTNGQVFRLAVKSGDTVISQFKGYMTVRFAVPDALKDKDIAAVHIGDNALEKLEGKRITQDKVDFYEFKTPHFSEFALVDTAEVKLDSDDKSDNIDKAKSLIKELKLSAVSSKTSKKNVKVTVKMNSKNKALIKELSDMGYTVKYKYCRSVKKASKYTAVKTKTSKTFINTKGKKGTRYYYRVKAVVYDGNKVVAQSALSQCSYAVRTWSK